MISPANNSTPGGSGTNLPPTILLLATISAVLSTLLSFWTCVLQLKNYRKIRLQRFVVRILVMVPIYSLSSLVSLYSLDAAFFIDAIRDVYEAFVIYCFFTLLVEYLGGERSLIILLHGRPPVPHPWPISTFLQPMDCSDPYTFLGLKRGVLQYVQIKPILALLTVVLKATDVYKDGDLAADSGYTYISVAYNLSVGLSLYCLAMFWVATHDDLQPFRPMPKFLCVKGIIFFSFWQGFGVSVLVAIGALRSSRYPTELLSLAIQDTLICFEMPLFAFMHLYAFSYTDYIDTNMVYSGRLPFLYALRDAFGLKDVLSDSLTTVKGTGFSYRTFEPAAGTLHTGLSLDRRVAAGLRYTASGTQKYWLPMPGDEADAYGRRGKSALLARPIHAVSRLLETRFDQNQGYGPAATGEEDGVDWREGEERPWDEGEYESSESLEFESDGESMREAYVDCRRMEFGDVNYPILDASREEAKRRMRDEEQGLIDRHRRSRHPSYASTSYEIRTSSNGTGKGKGKEKARPDYFNTKRSSSSYGHYADTSLTNEDKSTSLDSEPAPTTSADHPPPEGHTLVEGAKTLLSSLIVAGTSSSDEEAEISAKNALPDDAIDLVIEDLQAEEEEMIRDRRRGEPGGKKKRVYRQNYLSIGGGASPSSSSPSTPISDPKSPALQGLDTPNPGEVDILLREVKDIVIETDATGEGLEIVRLRVREEEKVARVVEVPEIFLEGGDSDEAIEDTGRSSQGKGGDNPW